MTLTVSGKPLDAPLFPLSAVSAMRPSTETTTLYGSFPTSTSTPL